MHRLKGQSVWGAGYDCWTEGPLNTHVGLTSSRHQHVPVEGMMRDLEGVHMWKLGGKAYSRVLPVTVPRTMLGTQWPQRNPRQYN